MTIHFRGGRCFCAAVLVLAASASACADLPTVSAPTRPVLLENHESIELQWIPPGGFTMGSPAGEPGRKEDEGPTTRVTLSRGFWLGRDCVTIGQWNALMGVGVRGQLARKIADDTVHDFGSGRSTLRDFMHWARAADPASYLANEDDNLPMYFVSWDDAMDFCRRLTAREKTAGRLPTGYEYSLPTEAQWEYACRAGTTTATYAGPSAPEIVTRLAWFDGNSAAGYIGRGLGPTHAGPRAVGLKEPNGWGLRDMYGNLWQWCRDWYGPYPGGAITDPAGAPNGATRVNRGGSFGSGLNSERSACRAANPPAEASAYRGFRIALVPVAPTPNS